MPDPDPDTRFHSDADRYPGDLLNDNTIDHCIVDNGDQRHAPASPWQHAESEWQPACPGPNDVGSEPLIQPVSTLVIISLPHPDV